MSDFLIDLLLYGNVVSLGFTLLLVVYLIMKQRIQTAEEKEVRAYLHENQGNWNDFFFYLQQVPKGLIPRNPQEVTAVERIFHAYLRNVSNPMLRDKVQQFSNQYLSTYYRRQLHHRKWSLRVNTLHRIADYQITSLLDDCRLMADGRVSEEEAFDLLYIFSIMDEQAFLEKLPRLSKEFTEFEWKKILLSLKPQLFGQMVDRVGEWPKRCVYSIIDIIGIRKKLLLIPVLEDFLSSQDAEERIRALKAINEIGVAGELGKYLHLLESPVWEERLMTARLLKHFPLSQTRSYLERLGDDESWWVRREALGVLGAQDQSDSRSAVARR